MSSELNPQEPPSENALSLFTSEPDRSNANAAARIPGVVSLDRIVAAAPLPFVEGIAVVQALCAALKDKAGVSAGMPDLRGVFLNESGEIVALTPPGKDPAAHELARLLHRLVPTESTPPVARLFVDRWTSGASTDLGAFASEIGYFARPNSRDLLTAVHARCAGTPGALPQPTVPAAVVPFPRVEAVQKQQEEDRKAVTPQHSVGWLQSHKRQILAVGAIVVATIAATGLATWFWPSKAAEATQPAVSRTGAPAPADAAGTDVQLTATATAAAPAARTASSRPKAAATAPRNARTSASAPSSNIVESRPEIGIEQAAPLAVQESYAVAPAALPSRGLPDLRIYSAADKGIEPPRLLSTEILEAPIAGFPTKTNRVEVIIDKRGNVERVRMQGPLQRIPDIMLLSRVKEWLFEPATKDGVPVRYSLLLSWNVTP